VEWNKDASELRLRYASHRGSSNGETRWTRRDVLQQGIVPFQVAIVASLVWMAFAPTLVTSNVVPSLSKLAQPMPVMLSMTWLQQSGLSRACSHVSPGPIRNNGLQILLGPVPVKTQQLPNGEAAGPPFYEMSPWS